jgi:hypothetical protein
MMTSPLPLPNMHLSSLLKDLMLQLRGMAHQLLFLSQRPDQEGGLFIVTIFGSAMIDDEEVVIEFVIIIVG